MGQQSRTAVLEPGADELALDALFVELKSQLRDKASELCRRERSPMFATWDLLNDLYLRLRKTPAYALAIASQGESEFRRFAACAMRHVLIDAARRRLSKREGGSFAFVTLSRADERTNVALSPEALLDLEDALVMLEAKHPRRAAMVIMRFYGGLTVRELQEYWGVSDATVERDLRLALKLLSTALGQAQ